LGWSGCLLDWHGMRPMAFLPGKKMGDAMSEEVVAPVQSEPTVSPPAPPDEVGANTAPEGSETPIAEVVPVEAAASDGQEHDIEGQAPQDPVETQAAMDEEGEVKEEEEDEEEEEEEEEEDGEYDFNKIKFVPVFEMDLKRPSIIVAGITLKSKIAPFKFLVKESTTIGDVERVLCDKTGCCPSDIGFFTAGWTDKHREPHEKLSDIFGPDAKEGIAYRFARKEMMQVSVWPTGYEERKAARIAKMKNGPMHGLNFHGEPLRKEIDVEASPNGNEEEPTLNSMEVVEDEAPKAPETESDALSVGAQNDAQAEKLAAAMSGSAELEVKASE